MPCFRMYYFYAKPPPEFYNSGSSNKFTSEKFVDQYASEYEPIRGQYPGHVTLGQSEAGIADQYASEYEPRSLRKMARLESVHNDISEWSGADNENNYRYLPPASSRHYSAGTLPAMPRRAHNNPAQRRTGKRWQTEELTNLRRIVTSAPQPRWARGFRSLHTQGAPRAERFSRQPSSSVMDKMIMVGFMTGRYIPH